MTNTPADPPPTQSDADALAGLLEQLHPSQALLVKYLVPNPNLPEHLRDIATRFYRLGCQVARDGMHRPDTGAETTTALRKLIEAKDCAVRAQLTL